MTSISMPLNHAPLNLDSLRRSLNDCPIGHTIHYRERTASTMLLAHAERAAATDRSGQQAGDLADASGAIFVTEEQSAGRGRMQRVWETPYASALLVSILLDATQLSPALRQRPQLLPMLVGVAAAHTLAALPIKDTGEELLGRCVTLKWPNDLLLAIDPLASPLTYGKVAGILLESSFHHNRLDYVVIGIGLNVNQTRRQFPPAQVGAPPPVSLRSSLGRCVDRTSLLVNLCRNLAALLDSAPSSIYNQWRALLHTLGQPVTVRTMDSRMADVDSIFEGMAIDVTPEGDLVVENSHRERRFFSAGAVTLRPN
ncbi:MAG: biotin--[acetyl-CoA-carboxylase] ligase [Caldilineaceae bacterium]|nr:biotin--[acetyl-CoA-carboxylase] ligase [Caldilineaceae bacterium]MCB0143055.1 biotin--[acetyl-CoA-carboxylase] ligase [Caldilineaceae bacterium]